VQLKDKQPEKCPFVFEILDGVTVEDLKRIPEFREFYGCFPSYLQQVVGMKCEPCKGNFGKIKTILGRNFPTSVVDDCISGVWYSTTRKNITKRYILALQDGQALVEHAPNITIDDLEILVRYLWSMGTREALEQATLLIVQWQSIGRVSETSHLTTSDLRIQEANKRVNLLLKLTRTKAGATQQELAVLPHPSERAYLPSLTSQCIYINLFRFHIYDPL